MIKTGPFITYAISHWNRNFGEKLHKLDGPVIRDQWKSIWCVDGKVHREDGPAIEWAMGYKEWYLHGIQYSEQEFNLIQLEKKLQAELSNKNNNNKKVKV